MAQKRLSYSPQMTYHARLLVFRMDGMKTFCMTEA